MQVKEWVLEVLVVTLGVVWLCLSKPAERKTILLPPSLMPEHYEISLAPRIDKGVFQGVVVISGVAITTADRIVLHCKNLLFNTTSLTDLTDDEELVIENIEEDIILQQCHLLLNQSLRVGNEYRLSLEFMGVIGKGGIGLYKDTYEEEGKKQEILTTHLQPNFARMLFPCFDEPHYKAQFLLRVSRQHFRTVLSNMPPATTPSHPDPEDNNHTWIEFEETPPMSTYLLVLVMCDYLTLTDSVTNNSVWAPRSRLHEAQLALNVSVAVFEYCQRYFDVEYALPKLDHVPVPSLNTVAMENWGAITYRRDFLLWEEGVSTWAQKEMISYVVCHEIVHQWLGNLVTTTWWNTTWLNEGIASFYHFYIMDKVEPTWNVYDNMFVSQVQLILSEEATKAPAPLTNNELFSQDAIDTTAFSASTYLKGAAILRMVFSLMPPDIFREAIVQYITDNEYSSVDEEDLWFSLAAMADLSVDLHSAMYTWTHQPGYPLVTVLRDSQGCISVRQEKYLAKDDIDARWSIPLTYTTSSELDFNSSKTVWLMEDKEHLELEECLDPDDWIILNIRLSGFYRVNYDPTTWKVLIHDLQNCDLSDIHPVNRGQLLHDSFDLARHGLLDYRVPLGLARYLTREQEFLPWYVAIQELDWLRARLYHTDASVPLQRYSHHLVENIFDRMRFSGSEADYLKELHRKQIVEFACGLHHPRCVKEATDTAYLLMSGIQIQIPLDLKPLLLCVAVRHGQNEVWHYVLKEYLTATENERWKYLVALGCTSNKEIVKRLLKDIVEPTSFIKSTEERLNLWLEVGKQDDSLEPILDMILEKFNDLTANFDFNVILHILNTFLTAKVTKNARRKISDIAVLVNKTQNIKLIGLMDSIVKEIDSYNVKHLDEASIKRALAMDGDEHIQMFSTSRPTFFEKDIPVKTQPTILGSDTTTQSSIGQISPPADGGSTVPVAQDSKGGNNVVDASCRKTIDLIAILILILICVIR